MLFHTWEFALFFLVVLIVSMVLCRWHRLLTIWLLITSYYFYAGWSPYYLLLIVGSTAIDFFAVQGMDRWTIPQGWGLRSRQVWLALTIVNNLALLCFFKYFDFAIDNANLLLRTTGWSFQFASAAAWMPFGWKYMLPVGISFYTFQSMSYAIDFYRGKLPREDSFIRFATFVAFFPQLVAGPIERSSNLLPQLAEPPRYSWTNLTDGMSLFLVGMFKKIALANYVSIYVERVYSRPEEHAAPALLLATAGFAWQIYFDFSAYTDMARGVARIMGYDLMLNFSHPYVATGLGEFWSRWHISLSTWFRDYLYIPLGGNRHSPLRTDLNLFFVFLVSGFWHGSAWKFIVWGLIHGIGLILSRRWERHAWYQSLPSIVKRLWVFSFVCVGWIFFRAESMHDATTILSRIVTTGWSDPRCPLWMMVMVVGVWMYQVACESQRPSWLNRWIGEKWLEQPFVNVLLAWGMCVYLLLCATGGGEFIYFQF